MRTNDGAAEFRIEAEVRRTPPACSGRRAAARPLLTSPRRERMAVRQLDQPRILRDLHRTAARHRQQADREGAHLQRRRRDRAATVDRRESPRTRRPGSSPDAQRRIALLDAHAASDRPAIRAGRRNGADDVELVVPEEHRADDRDMRQLGQVGSAARPARTARRPTLPAGKHRDQRARPAVSSGPPSLRLHGLDRRPRPRLVVRTCRARSLPSQEVRLAAAARRRRSTPCLFRPMMLPQCLEIAS